MPKRLLLSIFFFAWTPLASIAPSMADETPDQALAADTAEFLKAHCIRCHQGERPKGKLDLNQFNSVHSLTTDPKRWGRIITRVQAGEMPPMGNQQPPPADRERFVIQTRQTLFAALAKAGP